MAARAAREGPEGRRMGTIAGSSGSSIVDSLFILLRAIINR